jgi:hypothetical protein
MMDRTSRNASNENGDDRSLSVCIENRSKLQACPRVTRMDMICCFPRGEPAQYNYW